MQRSKEARARVASVLVPFRIQVPLCVASGYSSEDRGVGIFTISIESSLIVSGLTWITLVGSEGIGRSTTDMGVD